MISDRQMKILNRLADQPSIFKKGEEFARELRVSVKTIQSDIKILKEELKEILVEIQASTGNGYRLQVENESLFENYRAGLLRSRFNLTNFEDQSSRILIILKMLLDQNDFIKSDRIADDVYISKSRLSSDLGKIRDILLKYNLELCQKPSYGLKIFGKEIDKRRCIIGENIPIFSLNNHIQNIGVDNQLLRDISDITVEEMVKARYKTSDVVLQNIIMHIYISVKRILSSQSIMDEAILDNIDITNIELDLANSILSELSKKYRFSYVQQEVFYLALNLLGKKNYENVDAISETVDSLVISILDKIRRKTGLDLTYDVELRISLALHLAPLLLRIEHNMQIENVLVDDIKKYFTLAYDLAVIASDQIQKEYEIEIQEDEIGYLAIHFNLSLQKHFYIKKPKRILILCSSRRSDSLLLKYKLLRWFKEMISEMEVRNFSEIPQLTLESYDVIFTTTFSEPLVPSNAIKINYFLDENDHRRIERVLIGISSDNEIVEFFNKDLFFPNLKIDTQNEVLEHLVEKIKQFKPCPIDFLESIKRREMQGSTAFGNYIAIPHPDGLVSDETFVCTGILEKPILWGNNMVQIIFLISIKLGNDKDLRDLFEILSKVLVDQDGINRLIRTPSYPNLVSVLKTSFERI